MNDVNLAGSTAEYWKYETQFHSAHISLPHIYHSAHKLVKPSIFIMMNNIMGIPSMPSLTARDEDNTLSSDDIIHYPSRKKQKMWLSPRKHTLTMNMKQQLALAPKSPAELCSGIDKQMICLTPIDILSSDEFNLSPPSTPRTSNAASISSTGSVQSFPSLSLDTPSSMNAGEQPSISLKPRIRPRILFPDSPTSSSVAGTIELPESSFWTPLSKPLH